jgi:hypothetical protein
MQDPLRNFTHDAYSKMLARSSKYISDAEQVHGVTRKHAECIAFSRNYQVKQRNALEIRSTVQHHEDAW